MRNLFMPTPKLSKIVFTSILVFFLAVPTIIVDSLTNHSFAQGNSGNGGGNSGGNGGGNSGGNGGGNSGGNGGGNSGGNGGGNSGGSSNGNSDGNAKTNDSNHAVAKDTSKPSFNSVMKGLNAYKANKNAFKNANSNSQVGRIASYVKAISVRKSSLNDLLDAQQKMNELMSSYNGRVTEDIEADIVNSTEAINNLTLEIQQIQSQLAELDQENENYQTDLESLNSQLSKLNQEQETNLASLETLEAELQVSLEFSNQIASIEQEVDQANTNYQDAITNEDIALSEATGNQSLSAEEIQQIESFISTLE